MIVYRSPEELIVFALALLWIQNRGSLHFRDRHEWYVATVAVNEAPHLSRHLYYITHIFPYRRLVSSSER